MTSKFSAHVDIDAGTRNAAIYDAIMADELYYDGPDNMAVQLNEKVCIDMEASRVSHLRAAVNSALRLALAADDTILSVDYNGAGGSDT